jgi:hypothetical protein
LRYARLSKSGGHLQGIGFRGGNPNLRDNLSPILVLGWKFLTPNAFFYAIIGNLLVFFLQYYKLNGKMVQKVHVLNVPIFCLGRTGINRGRQKNPPSAQRVFAREHCFRFRRGQRKKVFPWRKTLLILKQSGVGF